MLYLIKAYFKLLLSFNLLCSIKTPSLSSILDSKGINFLISYDGECGGKEYGEELPVHLGCKKIMLNAGLSSQALLLGKKSTTFEALYISKNLSNFFNPQFELFPMEAMI